MRLSTRLLVTGAATALLAGGSLGVTSAASAAEPEHTKPDDGKVEVQATNVTTWVDANIRDEPTTNTTVDRRVGAGTVLPGACYDFGETVTDHGVTNDKWISIETGNPFDEEWIWAGALEGNETGGVPNQC